MLHDARGGGGGGGGCTGRVGGGSGGRTLESFDSFTRLTRLRLRKYKHMAGSTNRQYQHSASLALCLSLPGCVPAWLPGCLFLPRRFFSSVATETRKLKGIGYHILVFKAAHQRWVKILRDRTFALLSVCCVCVCVKDVPAVIKFQSRA